MCVQAGTCACVCCVLNMCVCVHACVRVCVYVCVKVLGVRVGVISEASAKLLLKAKNVYL